MKLKVIVWSLLICIYFCGYSQEIEVSNVEKLESDISARTQPYFDLNGDPCALVKVNLVVPQAGFDGNVVHVLPKNGQYWVYLVSGTKGLTINHSKLLPCKIDFKDFGINKVEEKMTYSITLKIPTELYAILVADVDEKDGIELTFDKDEKDPLAEKIKALMDNMNYDEAFVLAKEGMEKGSVNCSHLISVMYYNGLGVEKSESLGHKYSGIAAEKGHPVAQRNYGNDFLFGRGSAIDEIEGVKWLEKAAQNNDVSAQASLGEIYSNGWGKINPDLTKSFNWTRNAAEQGNAVSQEQMGFKYYDGIGVIKDYRKAKEWFQKAIDNGCVSAYANLGISYREGEGVLKNYNKAEELFLNGAELGDAYAACLLGHLYQWCLTSKKSKALDWYIKASDMGSEEATEILIDEYSGNSYLGVTGDLNKSNYYKKRLNVLRSSK